MSRSAAISGSTRGWCICRRRLSGRSPRSKPRWGSTTWWPDGFVGREAELARLDAAVSGGGPVVVAAVHGLGGVGKSSLAAYWAGTRDHGCAPIIWIRADSFTAVEQGLAAFATRLQPALAEALPVEELAERGLQWLASHTGWLLILDNVEHPADIAAVRARARGGRVLITGRLSVPWQAGATVICLDVLLPGEAEQLLTRLATATGPRDLDGATELCAALGYLPLAIEQAGAYLAHLRFRHKDGKCHETPGAWSAGRARRTALTS